MIYEISAGVAVISDRVKFFFLFAEPKVSSQQNVVSSQHFVVDLVFCDVGVLDDEGENIDHGGGPLESPSIYKALG